MNKKLFWLLTPLVLAATTFVKAQQPTKAARIGYLGSGSPAVASPQIEAFRKGLRDLGYMEGQNIVVEYRYADGKLNRLPELAAELVRLNVAVIVAGGGQSIRAAKNATNAIPIVMAQGR